jgi:ubiquinone/menaquinone biosynthesis C-methylase UbiE
MNWLKKLFLNVYYFGNNSKQRIEHLQKQIRDIEWDAVADFIKPNSSFLDIGAGSGYFLKKARAEMNCEVFGIDTEPNAYGVGRFSESGFEEKKIKISKGSGENLPYKDKEFDVVFSSHVLEHVTNKKQFLKEANRVLKDEGVLIIGMPTSTMAWISLLSQIIFTTHQRLFNFIFDRFSKINTSKVTLINVILPFSHVDNNKTVLNDINQFKVKKWEYLISEFFIIQKKILPAVYPYPDYKQLFRIRKNKRFGSSVFFICKKKKSGI